MRKMPSRAPVFLFRNVAPGGGRRLLGLNAFRIALICWRNQEFAIPLPPSRGIQHDSHGTVIVELIRFSFRSAGMSFQLICGRTRPRHPAMGVMDHRHRFRASKRNFRHRRRRRIRLICGRSVARGSDYPTSAFCLKKESKQTRRTNWLELITECH